MVQDLLFVCVRVCVFVFQAGLWTGGMMILLLYQYCNTQTIRNVLPFEVLRIRANLLLHTSGSSSIICLSWTRPGGKKQRSAHSTTSHFMPSRTNQSNWSLTTRTAFSMSGRNCASHSRLWCTGAPSSRSGQVM